MSALKRAMLYISGKKGKSILLLLIFFVISTLIITAMTIHNAADMSARQLRESIGGYFKITNDLRNPNPQAYVNDVLIESISEMDGIKMANAMDTLYLTT